MFLSIVLYIVSYSMCICKSESECVCVDIIKVHLEYSNCNHDLFQRE